MSEQAPPAPTASVIGPCPTIIQIVGHTGTGNLPRTIAPSDHLTPPPPPALEVYSAPSHHPTTPKSECSHIKASDGNKYYSTKEISNAIDENFQKNSSSSIYSQQFQDVNIEKERDDDDDDDELKFNDASTHGVILRLEGYTAL